MIATSVKIESLMIKPLAKKRAFLFLCSFFISVAAAGCAASPKAIRKDKVTREVKHNEEARKFADSYVQGKKSEEKTKVLKAPEASKPSKSADATWNSIRQRKVDASKPLTLSELIDIALRNNPLTRQAWYNAALQLAKEKQEEAALFPAIGVFPELTKEKKTANITSKKINQREYSVNVELTYLLFDFGGRSASIEETVQKLAAANFQYNQAVQDLLLAVGEAYYGFYSAQSVYDAAVSTVMTSKKDFDAAKARFDAGVVVRLDVL